MDLTTEDKLTITVGLFKMFECRGNSLGVKEKEIQNYLYTDSHE